MRRQRGMALALALLVLAIAAILAYALIDQGAASRATAAAYGRQLQAAEIARGLEAWVGEQLRRDLAEREAVDSRNEEWAGALPPLPFERGTVTGRITDLDGRYDLNALVKDGVVVDFQRRRLERLLTLLDLPAELAPAIADYLDADALPLSGGAEDADYLGLDPPRRPANRPFSHIGELLYVRGVSPAIYARLLPQVTALPPGSALNVNTASLELLMALHPQIDLPLARQLYQEGRAQHANLGQFLEPLAPKGIALTAAEQQSLSVQSRHFELRATIVLDGVPHAARAVIQRSAEGVRVIERGLTGAQ